MDERVRAFLDRHHAAAMITLNADGSPHVARVGVGLVEGRLWSSGTRSRIRAAHVRRDPRSALMVISQEEPWKWLGLETVVTIHDGPDAAERNLALYRVLRGEPEDLQEYMDAMVREGRLIYEFEILRAYGQY